MSLIKKKKLLLPLSFLFCLLTVPAVNQSNAAKMKSSFVQLVVHYGNGASKSFKKIPYSKGMTGQDVMNGAKKILPKLSFVATKHPKLGLFMRTIDGLEGIKKKKAFWHCAFNKKPCTKSYAKYIFKPGDQLIWTYKKY